MKKIAQIYKEYEIPLNLQEHQFRVAAVAKQICDNLEAPVDTEVVVTACLLHDMGNIIKFNLRRFPEFVEKPSPAYWEQVQKTFINKYGNDEHHATQKIAKEIGVSGKVLSNIDAVGFSAASNNAKSDNFENKICSYADMRVGPFGVLTLAERLEEARQRYRATKRWISNPEKYKETVESLHKIEKQIFDHSSIEPNQITNESIGQYIAKLKKLY